MQRTKYTAPFALPLCLILVSLSAYGAGPYRLELDGGFSSVNTDESSYDELSGPGYNLSQTSAGDSSLDRLGFSGAYYFSPVETNSGP